MDSSQQEQQPEPNTNNAETTTTTTATINKKKKYKILILGASYGSLLAIKILIAGHDVTLICRESTAALFNERGSVVRMPIKGSHEEMIEIRSKDIEAAAAAGGGTLTACTPESVLVESSSSSSSLTSRFDLAVLAMQEPQYSAPGVRELVIRIAHDAVPTMAITNMPLIPYLKRIIPNFSLIHDHDTTTNDSNESSSIRSCFTEPDLWTQNFTNPDLFTQCSPDPQAFRPSADTQPNVLQVRLPTNFKAAKFGNDVHTQILKRLEQDIEAIRFKTTEKHDDDAAAAADADADADAAAAAAAAVTLQIPVKLRVHNSLFVPLAKWAMLLAGNYRCVQPFPADMVSIQQAVTSNLDESRAVYDWVVQVSIDLGHGDNNNNNHKASLDDFVPFEKYAAAAKSLTSPSSAARALAAGATSIERVDKLVMLLAARQGKENATVTATVAAVDEWLAQNQNKKKLEKEKAAAEKQEASK